jgi:mannitol/fructose-specific phosphotransferase system IIA component (Ntr-type)
MFCTLIWCTVATVLLCSPCRAQDAQAREQALRDMQIGMQGLQQAGEDPALLAQLMRDMQDPELMQEAQKMMRDPTWQKQMKELQNSKDFKESVKKTKDLLSDPNAAAHAEAKLEHMVNVGNDQLKKGAASAMEEAMAAMANPEAMAELTKMMKDPNFVQDLQKMAKNPEFASYIEAAQDMMKDPSKKRKFEAVADEVRASL